MIILLCFLTTFNCKFSCSKFRDEDITTKYCSIVPRKEHFSPAGGIFFSGFPSSLALRSNWSFFGILNYQTLHVHLIKVNGPASFNSSMRPIFSGPILSASSCTMVLILWTSSSLQSSCSNGCFIKLKMFTSRIIFPMVNIIKPLEA